MSVQFILGQVGKEIGLNPSLPSARTTLLRFLNEAARELYSQSDPDGAQMEKVFKVNGDQTISCPSYVGSIRAIREIDSQIAWSITKMRPRYNQFNWTDSWRNIRLLDTRALMQTITNASVCVVSVGGVENPPVQVTITGSTVNATSTSETVIMSQLKMETVSSFTDITSVKKDRVNNFDIVLSDIDGKLLTTIPNNQLAAQYQILDVSICPWLATSTNTLEHYVEILYKVANTELSNDSDEFCFGKKYDDVLVNKCIQLWYEKQGKPELAMAFDTKATRTLARLHEDKNRATEDMISVSAHPHDQILPRIRSGRRRYYRGFSASGY